MKHEVKVPSAGESVTEAFVGEWHKSNGELVKKGDVIVDLESQKATFEMEAETSGKLAILRQTEDKVGIHEVIATIDDAFAAEAEAQTSTTKTAVDKTVTKPAETVKSQQTSSPDTLNGPSSRDGLRSHAVATSTPAAPTNLADSTAFYDYTVDETRGERKKRATRMRRLIAQNLVAAQHTAAILTSFNEVDMTNIMALRKKHKDSVLQKTGVKIGMMGMFAMACKYALQEYPHVNYTFTGDSIIERDFIDISIAVSTDTGLVVPVVRDCQDLDWIGFDKQLAELASKAREGKLSIPEMTGGTFTITNGGVFGSLVSTPLLNMPQSAILGMHTIKERPVAVDGKVEIRPMMYTALSYDHRLLDGKDAVLFLIKLKEGIENPELIIDESKLK